MIWGDLMGLRVRKSFKVGPMRVNVSKSGVGYSVGTKGVRVTKKASGVTRTTVSVPGTGVSYVKETSKKAAQPTGCLTPIIVTLAVVIAMVWLLTGCGAQPAVPSAPPSAEPSAPATVTPDPEPSWTGTLPGRTPPGAEPSASAEPSPSPSVKPSEEPTPSETPAPSEEPSERPSAPSGKMVWIPKSGAKYHSKASCSGMEGPKQVTLSEAEALGFTACKRCY